MKVSISDKMHGIQWMAWMEKPRYSNKTRRTPTNSITRDGETLEEVEISTYLNCIIDEREGFDADMETRVGKTTTAFLQLKNIYGNQNNCQPILKSQSSRQTSRHFYYMGLKLGELPQPSSKAYKYL
ncbi:unnamed protein product [Schistosoma margrebowiei]|uniref:Uncharacterized protein n=1 Tax=Schistosoma margrebowiei TaxID=48269 RepID=A0A183MUW6_9TREM|nr:unnamed protein product [Schistosoma margrebowiei]